MNTEQEFMDKEDIYKLRSLITQQEQMIKEYKSQVKQLQDEVRSLQAIIDYSDNNYTI